MSRRGLIGGAGIFSVVAMALLGAYWIAIHSTYWEGQADCSASIGGSALFRYCITIGALLASIVIIVGLIRIATRPVPPMRTIAAYWVSTAMLWVMLAATVTVSVSVNLCLRGLSP